MYTDTELVLMHILESEYYRQVLQSSWYNVNTVVDIEIRLSDKYFFAIIGAAEQHILNYVSDLLREFRSQKST